MTDVDARLNNLLTDYVRAGVPSAAIVRELEIQTEYYRARAEIEARQQHRRGLVAAQQRAVCEYAYGYSLERALREYAGGGP